MAAGAALAAKRGETSKRSLKGVSKQMAASMSEKQLKEFASTKRKKLPTKKSRRSYPQIGAQPSRLWGLRASCPLRLLLAGWKLAGPTGKMPVLRSRVFVG